MGGGRAVVFFDLFSSRHQDCFLKYRLILLIPWTFLGSRVSLDAATKPLQMEITNQAR